MFFGLKKGNLSILIINIIVSLISCFIYFLFFSFVKENTIYKTEIFHNLFSEILIIILYCYLSVYTNIYTRKKFNLINSSLDLLKQSFPILCWSFFWNIILYLSVVGFNNQIQIKDLIEFLLCLFVPCLIFYTLHLISYKLKEIFNNSVFEKIIFVVSNVLLTFFTLNISATIITVFDISKISIIFIVPILFIGLFLLQCLFLQKILYSLDIKYENFGKDIIVCTIISSVIYLLSIANEIMFTVLKADFDNAKLITLVFIFIYSLITCIKTKILKILFTIIFCIYILLFIWNFKLNDFKPLNNYQKIKKEIWKESAIRHFPKDIPENVKNVEYDYYQNDFFGGETIYLVFTVDEEYIKNEILKYQYQEIVEPRGYSGNCEYTYRSIGYDIGDFRIYAIEKDGIYSKGIAVNEKLNQLMYFYSYPD